MVRVSVAEESIVMLKD